MRSIDPRFALVALFALAGCGGGAVSSSLPSTPQSPQSAVRAPLSQHDDGKSPGAKYAGVIQDLLPCGPPGASCTGAFTVTLKRDGSAISGTWTQDFTNPTFHDQGTFSGVMTSSTTFKATFRSPTDAPCTITVTGTLTPSRLDATYTYDPDCGVVDNGLILLRRAGGGDSGNDRGDHGDRGDGGHGD